MRMFTFSYAFSLDAVMCSFSLPSENRKDFNWCVNSQWKSLLSKEMLWVSRFAMGKWHKGLYMTTYTLTESTYRKESEFFLSPGQQRGREIQIQKEVSNYKRQKEGRTPHCLTKKGKRRRRRLDNDDDIASFPTTASYYCVWLSKWKSSQHHSQTTR